MKIRFPAVPRWAVLGPVRSEIVAKRLVKGLEAIGPLRDGRVEADGSPIR
jgi:hypothetical protein